MKWTGIMLAGALTLAATTAHAGGLGDAVIEPEVIAQGVASSTPGVIIPILLFILIAAALASGGGGPTPIINM